MVDESEDQTIHRGILHHRTKNLNLLGGGEERFGWNLELEH